MRRTVFSCGAFDVLDVLDVRSRHVLTTGVTISPRTRTTPAFEVVMTIRARTIDGNATSARTSYASRAAAPR